MKNTVSRAEKNSSRTITFKNKEHEKFYMEYLPKCRYQDVYHKALVYCNGTPSVNDYDDAEEQVKECRCYTIGDLFCCGYARYFWEAIKIRYPEYCFYVDWEDMYAED